MNRRGGARHYFLQDMWAAKKVYVSKVSRHYDVGSRLDGFIAQCLVFTEVVMLDVRPLALELSGVSFQQVDCTAMTDIADASIPSLSSLHAVEHIGLGRYGDRVDPHGYLKAIKELKRVVSQGGNLLFSVPVGRQRLEFNAHRVFDPAALVDLFDGFDLVDFAYIDDREHLHEGASPQDARDLEYGCGLYHFSKR